MTSEKEICIMRTLFSDKKGFTDKLSAECDQQFYYMELSNEKCATLVT
jgi:hypothetical protein